MTASVSLQPTAAALADALRKHRGLVPYDVLIRRLWPRAEYAEHHARQHLRELAHQIRSAYEDETGELVIATVINRGYVWTGPRDG